MKPDPRTAAPEDLVSDELRATLRENLGVLVSFARSYRDAAVVELGETLRALLASPAPLTRRALLTLAADLDERMADFFARRRASGDGPSAQLRALEQSARRQAAEKRAEAGPGPRRAD
jgi:hypothetical protein